MEWDSARVKVFPGMTEEQKRVEDGSHGTIHKCMLPFNLGEM